MFNKSVEKQYKGFHEGFLKVCGGRVMKLFKPHELMAVVVGSEDYDWNEFETHAEYKNGYTSSDPTVRMFWEVFHELSVEDKKKFLLFLTGSDRIPIQGMKGIKIFIQPVNDDNLLCVAHTCFNLLGKLHIRISRVPAIHFDISFNKIHRLAEIQIKGKIEVQIASKHSNDARIQFGLK